MPRARAHAVQPTTYHQTYPIGCPRAVLHPQKVFYLGFRVPLNVKYDNFSRASNNRTSGLVGSHTTPPIVEIKYMISLLREGYFGLPMLGSEYY
jgi:hypothetical protein